MRTFSLIMDRLFRFFQRLIVTPFLFGWLILWLLLGAAFSTLVATAQSESSFHHAHSDVSACLVLSKG